MITKLDDFAWTDSLINEEIDSNIQIPLSRIEASGDGILRVEGIGINDGLFLVFADSTRKIVGIDGTRVYDLAYVVLDMKDKVINVYKSYKKAYECTNDDETWHVVVKPLIE